MLSSHQLVLLLEVGNRNDIIVIHSLSDRVIDAWTNWLNIVFPETFQRRLAFELGSWMKKIHSHQNKWAPSNMFRVGVGYKGGRRLNSLCLVTWAGTWIWPWSSQLWPLSDTISFPGSPACRWSTERLLNLYNLSCWLIINLTLYLICLSLENLSMGMFWIYAVIKISWASYIFILYVT